ncbi:MAG: signal recognition particle-docking protein FtsY [Chloroflexi bacterium]|nr:MAG: signal recognition particle-docking protein FtsY [Chloroflexota bacterium]
MGVLFASHLSKVKKSWLGKIAQLFERSGVDEHLWEELEELLILADVGVATAGKLVEAVRGRVEREEVKEVSRAKEILKQEMVKLLQFDQKPFSKDGKPEVILAVGVNGTGKTTSIGKLAHRLKSQGKEVILAAADTFRAAAIEQLKYWGERVEVPVISHKPGGDPGAVVFDALEAAKARRADFLIVDTAGRLHTKFNLMEELKKIRRVITRGGTEPEVLLVLDATTGQNGLTQARYFTEAVGVDGILLAKLDSTAKGGIVLAICAELKIPIWFVGTGQELDDLAPFEPLEFVEAIIS